MAEKSLKNCIVSFRIPQEQNAAAIKYIEDKGVLHASSVAKFFRKIGLDLITGKLAYVDEKDMRTDPTNPSKA